MEENDTYSIHNLVSKLFGFFSIEVVIHSFILPRKCEADIHGLHKLFWEVTRENIHNKNKINHNNTNNNNINNNNGAMHTQSMQRK